MYLSLASVGRCIVVFCGLKCILLKTHFQNYILWHNYWFHCQIPHKWVFQFYQRPIHYSKVNTSCGDRKEVTPNLAQYVAFITIHVPLGLVQKWPFFSMYLEMLNVLTHSLSLFLAGFSSTVTVDLFASVFQPGGSSHMRNRAQLVWIRQPGSPANCHRRLCH